MRKLGIALGVIMIAGLLDSRLWACPWGGYGWGGSDAGYSYGSWMGPGGGDYQKFLDETEKLRSELAAKEAEYEAFMAQPNPDPKRAAALSQEIFNLQNELQKKGRDYGYAGNWPMRHHSGRHRHGCSCGWGSW